jgi:hypothetical protein
MPITSKTISSGRWNWRNLESGKIQWKAQRVQWKLPCDQKWANFRKQSRWARNVPPHRLETLMPPLNLRMTFRRARLQNKIPPPNRSGRLADRFSLSQIPPNHNAHSLRLSQKTFRKHETLLAFGSQGAQKIVVLHIRECNNLGIIQRAYLPYGLLRSQNGCYL